MSIRFLQLHVFCREKFELYHDGKERYPVFDKPVGCCGIGENTTTWYQEVQWVLFTVGNEAALAATIFYWASVYTPGSRVTHIIIVTRGVNAAIAFLDIWITGVPVRLLHFVYTVIFGAIYIIFTGIYFAARKVNSKGEPFIYSVLDYGNHPGTAAAFAVVSVLIILPIIHLIFWIMYILREGFIRNVCPGERYKPLTNNETTAEAINEQDEAV